MVLAVVLGIGVIAFGLAWCIFSTWSPEPTAPRVSRALIEEEVRSHPRVRAWLRARTDPSVVTGVLLTTAVLIITIGLAGLGVLLWMVRAHEGFADFDLAAARFGADHASASSTHVLRLITQLGGAVVLVPLAVVFAALTAWRQHAWKEILGFLLLCVAGQFLAANLVKAAVDRARPNLLHLTGFAGSSFPSGHATAAAATFAAMALVAGRGRSRKTRALLGALAVALTVVVSASRVVLGVHWLTDVLAGMCLGWAWFGLSSLAFGGRLLRFGAPAEEAANAAQNSTGPRGELVHTPPR